jgi:hypothetical protein
MLLPPPAVNIVYIIPTLYMTININQCVRTQNTVSTHMHNYTFSCGFLYLAHMPSFRITFLLVKPVSGSLPLAITTALRTIYIS